MTPAPASCPSFSTIQDCRNRPARHADSDAGKTDQPQDRSSEAPHCHVHGNACANGSTAPTRMRERLRIAGNGAICICGAARCDAGSVVGPSASLYVPGSPPPLCGRPQVRRALGLSSSSPAETSWFRRRGAAGVRNCDSLNSASFARALASAIRALTFAIPTCAAPATASATELSKVWSGAPGIRVTSFEVAATGAAAFLLVWFVLLTVVVIWDFCSSSKRSGFQPL